MRIAKQKRHKFLKFMTTPEGDSGAGTQGDAGAGQQTAGENDSKPGAAGDEGGKVTFSPEQQAHMDKVIQERLDRQAKSLKKGQNDDDQGQKPKQEEQAKPPAGDTATPLTQEDINKAVQDALAAHTAKSDLGLVRAEIKALAAQAGFHDPATAAVLLAATPTVDLTSIKVTDGQPDSTALADLLKELATKQPFLVKEGGSQEIPGVGSSGSKLRATDTAAPGQARMAAAYAATNKS